MLANLLARMRVGGLQQATDHWVLDEKDGSYAYAIVAGGVRKVIIVVGEVAGAAHTGVRSVVAQIPDFLSGVVIGGTIPAQNPPPPDVLKLSSFWPTARCAALFNLSGGIQQSARLAVEPYVVFDELRNPSTVSPTRPIRRSHRGTKCKLGEIFSAN